MHPVLVVGAGAVGLGLLWLFGRSNPRYPSSSPRVPPPAPVDAPSRQRVRSAARAGLAEQEALLRRSGPVRSPLPPHIREQPIQGIQGGRETGRRVPWTQRKRKTSRTAGPPRCACGARLPRRKNWDEIQKKWHKARAKQQESYISPPDPYHHRCDVCYREQKRTVSPDPSPGLV